MIFYTFDEFQILYNINNSDYLKYFQLIASISNELKTKLRDGLPINNTYHTLLNKVESSKQKPNKILYAIQIKSDKKHHQMEIKWLPIIGTLIEHKEWNKIFSIPSLCSIDTTLRTFQFKYIHRLIATNKYLYKCKLTNSNFCNFCSEYIETIEHLFWECRVIQHLWNILNNLFTSLNVNIHLNIKVISFGVLGNSKKNNIVNFLIVLMKFYIYGMKLRNSTPVFEGYLYYVDLRYKIERQIAFMNDRLPIHEQKWHLLKEIMNLSETL